MLTVAVTAAAAAVAAYVVLRFSAAWGFAALAAATLVGAAAVHALGKRVREMHDVVSNALSAFRDGDFALRLTVRGDREVAELKRLCNQLADAVQADRRTLREKEILLDTILQRTPIAVALLDGAERVVYSNAAARQLLVGGAHLNGRLLPELPVARTIQQALGSQGEAIFGQGDETFHLSQRLFRINARPHRLLLVERLTPELRRRELAVWKKAIRVINHELNNSIAPISSLVHSARRAQQMPEHRHKIDEIHALIDERLAFLARFLAGYAEFARLPAPRKQPTRWADILEAVRPLYAFRLEGSSTLECVMDPAQMKQVLINLVKNAHESGSAPEEIVVSVQAAGEDCVLRVSDRGRGMSEDVLRQALVPFYTTKPDGSGLGLPLCHEIVEAHGGSMRLQAREGGGTVVSCWLPEAISASRSAAHSRG